MDLHYMKKEDKKDRWWVWDSLEVWFLSLKLIYENFKFE